MKKKDKELGNGELERDYEEEVEDSGKNRD